MLQCNNLVGDLQCYFTKASFEDEVRSIFKLRYQMAIFLQMLILQTSTFASIDMY